MNSEENKTNPDISLTEMKVLDKGPPRLSDPYSLYQDNSSSIKDLSYRSSLVKEEATQLIQSSLDMSQSYFARSNAENKLENWAQLQKDLKDSNYLLSNETETKAKLTQEIKNKSFEHAKLMLKIRENNEIIQKNLAKEIINEDVTKVLLDKNAVFGEIPAGFVEELLFTLRENPKILAHLIKTAPDSSFLETIAETLCSTFYQDILTEDASNLDLVRLFAALMDLELDRSQKQTLPFNKLLSFYLKSNECKEYMKSLLANSHCSIARENEALSTDPFTVGRELILKNTSIPGRQPRLEELKPPNIPKFPFKGPSGSQPQKQEHEESKEAPRKFKQPECGLDKIEDKNIVHELKKNYIKIGNYTTELIQSMFDNVYNMPTIIRLLCVLLHKKAKERMPNGQSAPAKEFYDVHELILRKWITPNFISPEKSGIVYDFQASPAINMNLTEVAKLVQSCFSQILFPEKENNSYLNSFIQEIQSSVLLYAKELISVNEDVLSRILESKSQAVDQLKSVSICISLQEIKLLCERIASEKEWINQHSPLLVKLYERVRFSENENESEKSFFTNKVDPDTKAPLAPTQCYLFFQKLVSPQNFVQDYVEQFNRKKTFDSKSSPEKKLLFDTKYLLTNFLSKIEDIDTVVRHAMKGESSFDNVLSFHQNKLPAHLSTNLKFQNHKLSQIPARFLRAKLDELPNEYRARDYERLYQEILEDRKKVTEQLSNDASTIKLQLLKAMDHLKRNSFVLNEINQTKTKLIKKSQIRDFLQKLKFNLCIQTPHYLSCLAEKRSLSMSQQLIKQISIVEKVDKNCIHQSADVLRNSFSKNNSVIGSKASLIGSDDSVLGDVFLEKNYHCATVEEFIQNFGNLKEVNDAMRTGVDEFGVNEAIVSFYEFLEGKAEEVFENQTDQEKIMILDEIEDYICRRLCKRVFPSAPTEADKKFWRQCKRLEWVTLAHLGGVLKNSNDKIWMHTSKMINEMDHKTTPLEKLECLVDFTQSVSEVLKLALMKKGGVGSEDTLPVVIYNVIKAAPERIQSNVNFIGLLRSDERMLAEAGFCYAQIKGSVGTILEKGHSFYNATEEEFEREIKEKEEQYGLRPESEYFSL